ncbi:expressed unknown protein [Seminavis robusta]|uniref:Uncharacterized protein n=1 Tax=Seminavis robusta TaxID=568900 RepID=A0A9N8HHW8_9STRA|nr:expressed unknown protein [Seminavis robusta]|eukprot:Sro468_g149170.1 n/a (190) ;mRNA; r:42578-43269
MIQFPSSALLLLSLCLLVSSTSGQEWWLTSEDDNGSNKPPVFPTACVKMALYNNTQCEGHPTQQVKYPTWQRPNDCPCFKDPTHPYASVDGQYCDTSQEIYHLSIYPLDGHCQTNQYTKSFAPVKIAVPAGQCYLGFKIKHCKQGPCIGDDDSEEVVEGNVSTILQRYLQNAGEAAESFLRGGASMNVN